MARHGGWTYFFTDVMFLVTWQNNTMRICRVSEWPKARLRHRIHESGMNKELWATCYLFCCCQSFSEPTTPHVVVAEQFRCILQLEVGTDTPTPSNTFSYLFLARQFHLLTKSATMRAAGTVCSFPRSSRTFSLSACCIKMHLLLYNFLLIKTITNHPPNHHKCGV